jgi:hypothetical protein
MEAATKEIVLDTVDHELYGKFVVWLYSKYIPAPYVNNYFGLTGKWAKIIAHRISIYADLWILGDFLCCYTLQNAAVDGICKDYRRHSFIPAN